MASGHERRGDRHEHVVQGSSLEDLQRVSAPAKASGPDAARASLPGATRWPGIGATARREIDRAVARELSMGSLLGFSLRPIDPRVLKAAHEVFHRDPGTLRLRVGTIRTAPNLVALTAGDTVYLDERYLRPLEPSFPLLLGRALAHFWQQVDGRAGASLSAGPTRLLRDPALEHEADVYAWLLATALTPPPAKGRIPAGGLGRQRTMAPVFVLDPLLGDEPPVAARRVPDGEGVHWILEVPKEVGKHGPGSAARRPGHTVVRHPPITKTLTFKGQKYRFKSTGPLTFNLTKVAKPNRNPTIFAVEEITFGGGNIPIEYARIPTQNVLDQSETYIRTGQYPPRHHLDPVVTLPAAGTPHWTSAQQNHRDVSWPAAYVRGAVGATLTASFTATGNFNGTKWVQATSNNGVQTNAVQANFVNGAANNVVFALTIPAGAVRRLSGFQLDWQIGDAQPPGQQMGQSIHSLFLVDAQPLAARGEVLFEIFDWACRCAHGAAGPANVVAAIWNQFSPVQNNHPTRLVYWKNHQSQAAVAQDLPTAIRSRDILVGGRRGASCVVFDRVFINSLAIHGIQVAEVGLTPAQYNATFLGVSQPCFFVDMALGPPVGTVRLFFQNPTGWTATTVVGHGNALAPDRWQNHWICAVQVGGAWTLYDPSYGLTAAWGGFALPGGPAPPPVAIPAAYEAAAVQHFSCTLLGVGTTVNLPSASPNPPHLVGTVLWHN